MAKEQQNKQPPFIFYLIIILLLLLISFSIWNTSPTEPTHGLQKFEKVIQKEAKAQSGFFEITPEVKTSGSIFLKQ